MSRRGLTYSKVIAWLKVLLPLAALALLSTMFLFARSVAPTSTVPFARVELEERARDQRITSPFLAGQTSTGYDIMVTAASARPNPENARISFVDRLHAQIHYSDARQMTLFSKSGEIDSSALIAMFEGSVRVEASNGYTLHSQSLTLNLDDGTATSETEITGDGPVGRFRAGAMELTFEKGAPEGRFLFTNGVKLVYTP